MVSTLDSESSDPSSNPGRTSYFTVVLLHFITLYVCHGAFHSYPPFLRCYLLFSLYIILELKIPGSKLLNIILRPWTLNTNPLKQMNSIYTHFNKFENFPIAIHDIKQWSTNYIQILKAKQMNVNFNSCSEKLQDEVAEWLRRWTANPLGSARVGSNPILVGGSMV